MSLLREIQSSVLSETGEIAPLLLKLRLLAARLESAPLEEWVKHETEGYPDGIEVPQYRIFGLHYTATFSGPFGSGIKNAPIPSYLIEKFAGEKWNSYEFRQSIAAADELVKANSGNANLHINSSNLILLLQGNVYEDYACNGVTGHLSVAQIKEVQHVVKSRILELTIQLEKSVLQSAFIAIGEGSTAMAGQGKVDQIFHQTIYGNMTNVTSTGSGATLNVSIAKSDQTALVNSLVSAGITKPDAEEFSEILKSEEPESKAEPFGAKAKAWIADNLKKAANGTWTAGVGVATDVLKQAALKFYGLE